MKFYIALSFAFFIFLDKSVASQMTEEELRPMIREALNMRGQQLLELTPKDIAQFCPNIDMQNAENRRRFWEDFFLAYINIESNRNPSASFRDLIQNPMKPRGTIYRRVEHIGLMQVSVQASAMAGCPANSRLELRDPQKNITCGVQIMNQLIPTANAGTIKDQRNPSYSRFPLTLKENRSNPPKDLNTIWSNENFPAYPLGKNAKVFDKLQKDVRRRCSSLIAPDPEAVVTPAPASTNVH